MNQCRHCLTTENIDCDICRVCGIPLDKVKSDLSPDEKKVRFHARLIRIIAMLHMIGAGVGTMMTVFYPNLAIAALILSVINVIIAVGLSRFTFWSYILAIAYYFLIGMVNIVSVNIPGTLLILILLYAVGNSTSKTLFERRFS